MAPLTMTLLAVCFRVTADTTAGLREIGDAPGWSNGMSSHPYVEHQRDKRARPAQLGSARASRTSLRAVIKRRDLDALELRETQIQAVLHGDVRGRLPTRPRPRPSPRRSRNRSPRPRRSPPPHRRLSPSCSRSSTSSSAWLSSSRRSITKPSSCGSTDSARRRD